jgi:hypothetical protein
LLAHALHQNHCCQDAGSSGSRHSCSTSQHCQKPAYFLVPAYAATTPDAHIKNAYAAAAAPLGPPRRPGRTWQKRLASATGTVLHTAPVCHAAICLTHTAPSDDASNPAMEPAQSPAMHPCILPAPAPCQQHQHANNTMSTSVKNTGPRQAALLINASQDRYEMCTAHEKLPRKPSH